MKKITVNELKIGDMFIYSDTPRIVDKVEIKDYGIVYVIYKFMNIDGELCRTVDIFDNAYPVFKISI